MIVGCSGGISPEVGWGKTPREKEKRTAYISRSHPWISLPCVSDSVLHLQLQSTCSVTSIRKLRTVYSRDPKSPRGSSHPPPPTMFGPRRRRVGAPILGTALVIGASQQAARREVQLAASAQVQRDLEIERAAEAKHRREREEDARVQRAVEEAMKNSNANVGPPSPPGAYPGAAPPPGVYYPGYPPPAGVYAGAPPPPGVYPPPPVPQGYQGAPQQRSLDPGNPPPAYTPQNTGRPTPGSSTRKSQYCPECGNACTMADRFCRQCGAKQA